MKSKSGKSVKRAKAISPRCIVIAGPNGAGKTTLAREFLPKSAQVLKFVNADLIAAGLSPLDPDSAAIAAGRLLLAEIDRLASERSDFAFETTLSGLTHASRLGKMKAAGYEITIIFITVDSPKIAMQRVAARVRQGGHNVPKQDILRRYERGRRNFHDRYQAIADSWVIYDNSGKLPRLLEEGP